MKHDVQYTTPSQKLGKADVSFSVKVDGETLGTLDISKGSLVWFPKKSSYGFKIIWKELANFMEKTGHHGERR